MKEKVFNQKFLPISQTLSLKPLDCTLLMLKPCVGVICEMSSEARTLSNVVWKKILILFHLEIIQSLTLPALSRPNSKIRSSACGVERSFRNRSSNP
jgi:hypothetical protein